MKIEDIKEFFDGVAATWDSTIVRNDEVIKKILDYAEANAGKKVLDVACGTGVLFTDYLERNVESITGIDVSSEMVKVATKKFKEDKIQLLCGDAQEFKFEEAYDCIVIYNAFPHFNCPEKLFENLASCLKDGGRITVAHGMSREWINARHSGKAKPVSVGLVPEDELAELMSRWFLVDIVISDKEKYIVSGVKK